MFPPTHPPLLCNSEDIEGLDLWKEEVQALQKTLESQLSLRLPPIRSTGLHLSCAFHSEYHNKIEVFVQSRFHQTFLILDPVHFALSPPLLRASSHTSQEPWPYDRETQKKMSKGRPNTAP